MSEWFMKPIIINFTITFVLYDECKDLSMDRIKFYISKIKTIQGAI